MSFAQAATLTPTLGVKMGNSTVRGAAVILAALPSVSFAAAPPSSPVEAVTWPQRYAQKPAPDLRLGKLTMELEKSTLPEILKAIGTGKVEHGGDAAGSLYWLCYSAGSSLIWLISHGEMGGNNHALMGVSAQRLPQGISSNGCPSLPAAFLPASVFNGLWVGMPESAFSSALSNPSHIQGAWRMYDHAASVTADGRCAPAGYDQENWLWYRVEGTEVIELQVGQVTSC